MVLPKAPPHHKLDHFILYFFYILHHLSHLFILILIAKRSPQLPALIPARPLFSIISFYHWLFAVCIHQKAQLKANGFMMMLLLLLQLLLFVAVCSCCFILCWSLKYSLVLLFRMCMYNLMALSFIRCSHGPRHIVGGLPCRRCSAMRGVKCNRKYKCRMI